jgi:hypothetical protein
MSAQPVSTKTMTALVTGATSGLGKERDRPGRTLGVCQPRQQAAL